MTATTMSLDCPFCGLLWRERRDDRDDAIGRYARICPRCNQRVGGADEHDEQIHVIDAS